MSVLGRITGPSDLTGLSTAVLAVLAQEIRAFLIDEVSGVGGHLGPNLGVVEMTIAAHRVFDSPHDVLLFDTGHQAYVHKILTGRCAEFDSLRQVGGLSGYPSRAESVHDVIENSHASSALSYADGLAKAFALRGGADRRIVAIVGDGALTGGMGWEALNNIGAAPDRPVIIVLNDNGRPSSPTIGGLARHLTELRESNAGPCEVGCCHTVFEDFGLAHLGPVDGHDIDALESALRQADRLRRPVVVHCVTRKGKGYPPAEQDETDHLHTVGVIDPHIGYPRAAGTATWTSVFAQEITTIGAERDDVVCLTAAMCHLIGLGGFATRFPDRTFDVGIAEQHAVTCAAGLALGGCHPVVAIYSTFLNRAFDQLLMDVALHHLPVTFVLDRAGVTGPDGSSHHGMWDACLLPIVPGLRLAAPRDCARLRELLREAVSITDGPTGIRYPKATVDPDIPAVGRIGHSDVLRDVPGAVSLLITVGPLAGPCLAAADELATYDVPVTVIDPRWIAPLDPELLKLAGTYRLVLTIEDTTTTGALGARIAQALPPSGRTPAQPPTPYHPDSCRKPPVIRSCAPMAWTPPASPPPSSNDSPAHTGAGHFQGDLMTTVHLGIPASTSPPAPRRRASRQVMVGGVPVGGDAPISVQSMTTTRTADIDATLQQIAELTVTGCHIVRVAVPSQDDAGALPAIAAKSQIPVIADIHFQPRYAFAALDAGCAAVRVNPGNIKKFDDKIKQIAAAALDAGVPIRIGVNAGSLDRLLAKHGHASAEALVESALGECSLFEEHGFHDIKIYVKHHDPLVMIAAYRQLAARCDYPLHLGVTEAGPLFQGTIKSAVAFGILLAEGIGDTLRVSLSAPPVEEVKVGHQILESLGLRPRRLEIVSCPSCGRAQVDVYTLTKKVQAAFEGFPIPLRIAVMGCVVNGPGEAREADLGVSAGNGKGQIFVRGKVIDTVPESRIVETLIKEALSLTKFTQAGPS
jgi:1-deoxy-D-xylulose-5-phosphate synthase